MRIGVDISSLAFKRQVNQIILISGDSDFVPAAKQARREGIDFILDPMRSTIKDDLFEHIDGIRTPTLYKKTRILYHLRGSHASGIQVHAGCYFYTQNSQRRSTCM